MRSNPTLGRLADLFDIDIETGAIYRKRSRGRGAAGSPAGSKTLHGYRRVSIDGAEYFVHSIIFFVAHGEWPSLVDHINGIRDDNRIENLRLADRASNARNRHKFKEGKLPGVHAYSSGQFAAVVTADGQQHRVGIFSSAQEAHAAYVAARAAVSEAERIARQQTLTKLASTVLEEVQAERMAA